MAAHSSVLSWRIAVDRGAWRGHKESGRTERLAQLVKMDKKLDCKHYSTICLKK